MLSVFFSYSHEDEQLRNQLEQQLTILKRQKVIATWHDRRIMAGEVIDHAIDVNLEAADIILLLISPAFLASDYCYDREMQRAMQRHAAQEAVVIPVILRPCEWHQTPFSTLLATPTDGKPVTQWADRDTVFLEVAKAIRAAAGKLQPAVQSSSIPAALAQNVRTLPRVDLSAAPRSSKHVRNGMLSPVEFERQQATNA